MNDNTKKRENKSKTLKSFVINILIAFLIFLHFNFFVAKPADQRTKYLQNRTSFMRGIRTKKNGAISQLEAEKITFPSKPDGQTYLQTDRHTDGHLLL